MPAPWERLIQLKREICDTRLKREHCSTESERAIVTTTLASFEQELAEVQIQVDAETKSNGSALAPIIWKADWLDLAKWISAAFDAGHLKADSQLAAFKMVCPHVRDEDGNSTRPDTLQKNFSNKRGRDGEGPRSQSKK